jgi:O-antigen/teichoic acid export membrane protein
MGNATALIRKNASWYAISIIISGLSSFGGIFLTKINLPANEFIHFNMQMSGITLFNVVTLGWFVQGITRFYHLNAAELTRIRILNITLVTSIFISAPFFLLWVNFVNLGQRLWYPVFYLIINSVYSSFSVRTQASLNARGATIAEIIRNIIVLAILGLPFIVDVRVNENYYWIGWILSNILPSAYLFIITHKLSKASTSSDADTQVSGQQLSSASDTHPFWELGKKMLSFGLPLSLWLLISAPVMNADRWYLSKHNLDRTVVANYLAIADMMLRGTLFLFSPLSSAAYPVLVRMFDENNRNEVKKVILKVIKWQVLMMAGAIAGFAILHKIVFLYLKIPPASERLFFILGVLLMFFHSLWSISAMLHKVAELQMRTKLLMLGNTAAAILSSLLLYVWVKPTTLIPVVLCFGSGIVLYFLYCIFLFRKLIIKSE